MFAGYKMADTITLNIPPASGDHAETTVWCPQGCGQELKFRQLVKTSKGTACPFCAVAIDGTELDKG